MTMLNTPHQIATFRLIVLRQGVEAEMRGMRLCRGRSATAITKQMFGLPRNAPKGYVLALLNAAIANAKAQAEADADAI